MAKQVSCHLAKPDKLSVSLQLSEGGLQFLERVAVV